MAHESFSNSSTERDAKLQAAAEDAGYGGWWEWVAAVELGLGHVICGAPRRKVYRPCRLYPAPNGRCKRYHGGAAPIGPAHPAYVDGAHSRQFEYLPGHLRTAAQNVVDDEKLVQSREQIAVLDVHAKDLLERGLPLGESGASWRAMKTWVVEANIALAKGEQKHLAEALKNISRLADEGVGEAAVWREYRQVAEDMRRQRETELSRMKYLSAFIAADRAGAIFHKLLDIVQTHVRDTEVLRLILLEVDEVFGRGAKNKDGERT